MEQAGIVTDGKKERDFWDRFISKSHSQRKEKNDCQVNAKRAGRAPTASNVLQAMWN